MTGHKSQGATIATKVVINIKKKLHLISFMSCFLESQIKMIKNNSKIYYKSCYSLQL
jgi:hypothetical protein